MQNGQKNALNGILLLISLCAIVAVIGLAIIIPSLKYSETEGFIDSADCTLESYKNSDGDVHHDYVCDISVKFKDSKGVEHIVSEKNHSGDGKLSEGTRIWLYYDENNPEDFVISTGDTVKTAILMSSISITIMIIVIIVYIRGIREINKKDKAKKTKRKQQNSS